MPDARQEAQKVFGWMALFKGLTPSQIAAVADDAELHFLEEGETLVNQGEQGDSFFVLISGRLWVTRGHGSRAVKLANLVPGDFVGEESFLYGTPRTATITAATASRVARFPKASFMRLLRTYPHIKNLLVATISTRRLNRKQKINWLDREETVYLIARKHVAYLLVSLVAPLILGWIGPPLFYFATRTDSQALSTVLNWSGLGFFLAGVLWGIWRYLDWGNDFYIVTNQRVVWLEKVIALYDSRQEAPLSTVLTVGSNSDFLARALGYGNVIVRTFTGQIVMQHVGYPEQLVGIIEEQLSRAKTARKMEEDAALEEVIRKRLGMDDHDEQAARVETPVIVRPAKGRRPPRPNPLKIRLADFFKVRYEEDGVITFRKHWILLLRKIWFPTLIIIGLIFAAVARLTGMYLFLPAGAVVVVALTFLLIVSLWWFYNYLDWSNDLYQITNEQIIDIYRKPLGKEDKKTAQLENILEIEHQRYGIIGLILNFGDVVAMVGGTRFTFTGVYNPAIVSQEIFLRINARKRRLKEAEAAAERERIADGLAAYHRVTHSHNGEFPPNSG